ncbi:MAG: GNAT family N-acetyltransferase, partial [Prochlorothrix sp.]
TNLSEESIYMRYFHLIKLSRRVAHERMARICFLDYDRDMVLVAEYQDPQTKNRSILGVGRLSKLHGLQEAEYALLISDAYQGKGLGTEVLQRLVQVGRNENLKVIRAEMLATNQAMQTVSRKVGFTLTPSDEDLVAAELLL